MTNIPVGDWKIDEEKATIEFIDGDEGFNCNVFVPLLPFDSGLDHVEQPETTALRFEPMCLDASDEDSLDGFADDYEPMMADASVYVGAAHNPIDVNWASFKKIDDKLWEIDFKCTIAFSYEGVGDDVDFNFKTTVKKDA